MDSAWRRFENWAMWRDVSPEVRRMLREIRKESLLYHDRRGTRGCYYSEHIRMIDLLYEHILEDRTHLMSNITPKEIYEIAHSARDALNLETVRKPVKIKETEEEKAVITVGRAWQIYLYDIYTSDDPLRAALVEGINEGHEGKKKGVLKDGDTVEINSWLPGGIVQYKVKIANDTEDFADNFDNDLRLEIYKKDIKKIFGRKDAEGKAVDELAGKDEFGWFKYKIRKVREPSRETPAQREHRFGQ